VVHPPPRHRAATPIDLQDAEHERERHERLGAIERHLHDVALAAAQAEDEREAEFRRNEEHREGIFLESQERREQEDQERTEHLWNTIQHRIEAIRPPELSDRPASTRPPSARPRTPTTPGIPGTPIPEVHLEARRPPESDTFSTDRASIKSVVEGVASRHADDILETVRLEREEFAREREAAAAEREHLMNEAEEPRRQLQEQQEARIKALEDELAAVKDELQNERQAKLTEEADIRERERSEFAERDEILRAQLNDITNLLQDNRDLTHQKKMDSDNRYAEKADRRQNKDYQIIELRDMVQKIHDDLQAEIQRATDERIQAQSKPCLFPFRLRRNYGSFAFSSIGKYN
jgi:DNA gyrase/topoisomerase IV subunit A